MINGRKIAVVMPAYNAAKTLEVTVAELPELVDIRILVDDHSHDETVAVAHKLGQCVHFGFRIGEVSCPTKYFEEASSINFRRSVKYGLGVLATTLQFAFQRMGLLHLPRFSETGRKLEFQGESYYARTQPVRS